MPRDLATLLRDAADEPVPDLDLDAVASAAGRRTRARRARIASGVAAALAVGVAAVVVVPADDTADVASGRVTTTTATAGNGIVVFGDAALDERVIVAAPSSTFDAGRIARIGPFGPPSVVERLPMGHGDFPDPVLVVDGHVVWADLSRAWAMYIGTGSYRSIGEASFLVPAVEPDRVWLVAEDRSMTKVDVAGGVHDAITLEPHQWPIRETVGGMLVDVGGRVTIAGGGPGAAGVAVAASARHALMDDGRVIDVGTGDRMTTARVDDEIVEAAFSPDGDRLAYISGPLSTRLANLVLVDVATGETVHRVRLQSIENPGRLTWSPDGDALYLLDLAPSTIDGARRVIGVPLGGAPTTLARFGAEAGGYYWLAVAGPSRSGP